MLIVLEVRNQRERDSEKNANIKCSLEGCLPFTDINSPIKRRFSANEDEDDHHLVIIILQQSTG